MSLRSRKMKSLGLHLMQPLYSEHRSQPLGHDSGISGLTVKTGRETGPLRLRYALEKNGSRLHHHIKMFQSDINFNEAMQKGHLTTSCLREQQGALLFCSHLQSSSHKPSCLLSLQKGGANTLQHSNKHLCWNIFSLFISNCFPQILGRFSFRETCVIRTDGRPRTSQNQLTNIR